MASSIGPKEIEKVFKDYYPQEEDLRPEVEAHLIPFVPDSALSDICVPCACSVLVMPNGKCSLALDERYIPLINPRIKEVFEVFAKFTPPPRENSRIDEDKSFNGLTNECFKIIDDYHKSKTGQKGEEFFDGFIYRMAWKAFPNQNKCANLYSIILSNQKKQKITVDPSIFNECFEQAKSKADSYINAFEKLKDIVVNPRGTEDELDESLKLLVKTHLDFLSVYKDFYHKADRR